MLHALPPYPATARRRGGRGAAAHRKFRSVSSPISDGTLPVRPPPLRDLREGCRGAIMGRGAGHGDQRAASAKLGRSSPHPFSHPYSILVYPGRASFESLWRGRRGRGKCEARARRNALTPSSHPLYPSNPYPCTRRPGAQRSAAVGAVADLRVVVANRGGGTRVDGGRRANESEGESGAEHVIPASGAGRGSV